MEYFLFFKSNVKDEKNLVSEQINRVGAFLNFLITSFSRLPLATFDFDMTSDRPQLSHFYNHKINNIDFLKKAYMPLSLNQYSFLLSSLIGFY